MTEFVLDFGSPEAAKRYREAGEFVQGYIEACFFTDTGTVDDNDLKNVTVDDLSEDAWRNIKRDCQKFLDTLPKDDFGNTWYDFVIEYHDYDEASCGRDFWYGRNGYGVGFEDRGLGELGEKLAAHARAFRSVDLYRGVDGLVSVLYLD